MENIQKQEMIRHFSKKWNVKIKDVENCIEEYHTETPGEKILLNGADINKWRKQNNYPHVPTRLIFRTLLSDLRRLHAEISYECDTETMTEAEDQWEE